MKPEQLESIFQAILQGTEARLTESQLQQLGKTIDAMDAAELKLILTGIFDATEARLTGCSPILRVLQDETHKAFEKYDLPNESPLGSSVQGQDPKKPKGADLI